MLTLLLGACGVPAPPETTLPRLQLPLLPPPTENVIEEGEEEEHHEERREWLEQMHRAPDGVDWRAAERRNARASLDRARAVTLEAAKPGGQWVERGSENQAGSMFEVRRATGGRLYAGSSLGGLWRGTVDGEDWTPIGDALFGGAHRVHATAQRGQRLHARRFRNRRRHSRRVGPRLRGRLRGDRLGTGDRGRG
ncbi:MAG: hypothetical protein KC621_22765, partial [Myxococcales bacterium]|nr:hypothetical protein [Myxococcales bacterium]